MSDDFKSSEDDVMRDTDDEEKRVPVSPKKKFGISNMSLSPRSTSDCSTDEINLPAPEGWIRQVVMRQGGATAGKFDVYYFSPLGKKLRSKKEVRSYCAQNDITINEDDFKFTHNSAKRGSSVSSTGTSNSVKRDSDIDTGTTPISARLEEMPNGTVISSLDSPKKLISRKSIMSTPTSEKSEVKTIKKKRMSKTNSKASKEDLTNFKLKSGGWVPPQSPFKLFQEEFYTKPWQMLIGTIFLNKSSNEDNVSRDFLLEFLKEWPTPEKTRQADWETVAFTLNSTSNEEKKARMIIKFSDEFITKKWTYPKELHGIGKFGNDSYRVFCMNEWKKVRPSDYLLNFYVDWLWDNHVVLEIE